MSTVDAIQHPERIVRTTLRMDRGRSTAVQDGQEGVVVTQPLRPIGRVLGCLGLEGVDSQALRRGENGEDRGSDAWVRTHHLLEMLHHTRWVGGRYRRPVGVVASTRQVVLVLNAVDTAVGTRPRDGVDDLWPDGHKQHCNRQRPEHHQSATIGGCLHVTALLSRDSEWELGFETGSFQQFCNTYQNCRNATNSNCKGVAHLGETCRLS